MRLMVVSTSCLLGVNRTAYRHLAIDHKVMLHLVVPVRRQEAAAHGGVSLIEGEPFPVTLLEMSGPHPRLERAKGLKALIQTWKPSHLLLEFDPATLLVLDAAQASRHLNVSLSVIALENRPRHFIREALKAMKGAQPQVVFGGVIAWWLLWSVRNRIQHVFTVSQDGTDVMAQLGFGGRITKIPLGFDGRLFYPQTQCLIATARRRLGLNSVVIAYFGRLVPEKGIDLLLQALSTLTDLRWQLLIDKFSPYRSAYEVQIQSQIQALGLTSRVVYFDASHSEIPDYMNAADIVVLPSISTPKFKEQYGRVIPEAMACGKIVVGSQSGAIPELIGEAGFVFPEGDASRLGKVLRYLLTAPEVELDSMRTKAVERAHAHFTAARQAEIMYRTVGGLEIDKNVAGEHRL
jgi:glycosyltransferase involved in cell wall biosynthesis